ncbi:hypothetical protein BH10CHL1_BH10CHL1_51030 [soil metagenome]
MHSNKIHDDEMDDDDRPIGRVLSRREILSLLGVAGSALFARDTTQLDPEHFI